MGQVTKLVLGILLISNMAFADCIDAYKKKASRRRTTNNIVAIVGAGVALTVGSGVAVSIIIGAGALGATATASTGAIIGIYAAEAGAIGGAAASFSLFGHQNKYDRIVALLEGKTEQNYEKLHKKIAKKLKSCERLSQMSAEQLEGSIMNHLNRANDREVLCNGKKVESYRRVVNYLAAKLKHEYSDTCDK